MSTCKCGCTRDVEKNCDGTHKTVTVTNNPYWPTCNSCGHRFHVDHYDEHQLTHKVAE